MSRLLIVGITRISLATMLAPAEEIALWEMRRCANFDVSFFARNEQSTHFIVRVVMDLLAKVDVLTLQETHGNLSYMQSFFGPEERTFHIHSSFTGGKGGLVTFIKKATFL